MPAWLAPVLGGAASALVGGLMGRESDRQAAAPQRQTVDNTPWAGIQPYLVGGDQAPGYLTGSPDMLLPWMQWAQAIGEGGLPGGAPPMLADYTRAQMDTEGDRVSTTPKGQEPKKKEKKEVKQPEPNPWVDDYVRWRQNERRQMLRRPGWGDADTWDNREPDLSVGAFLDARGRY